jgi:hypothetical protein
VLVQALIPKPADEALHKRVLDRLAGSDEAQPHPDPCRPANSARPVNSGRCPSRFPPAGRVGRRDRRGGARPARRRSRGRSGVPGSLPGGVVDEGQAAKAPAGPRCRSASSTAFVRRARRSMPRRAAHQHARRMPGSRRCLFRAPHPLRRGALARPVPGNGAT